jgi:hypothetical protein
VTVSVGLAIVANVPPNPSVDEVELGDKISTKQYKQTIKQHNPSRDPRTIDNWDIRRSMTVVGLSLREEGFSFSIAVRRLLGELPELSVDEVEGVGEELSLTEFRLEVILSDRLLLPFALLGLDATFASLLVLGCDFCSKATDEEERVK